jgi:hypothetical protein
MQWFVTPTTIQWHLYALEYREIPSICIQTMFGSSLPPVVCKSAHALFTLFVFVCILCCAFVLFVFLCISTIRRQFWSGTIFQTVLSNRKLWIARPYPTISHTRSKVMLYFVLYMYMKQLKHVILTVTLYYINVREYRSGNQKWTIQRN